jgi:hypothetical protein
MNNNNNKKAQNSANAINNISSTLRVNDDPNQNTPNNATANQPSGNNTPKNNNRSSMNGSPNNTPKSNNSGDSLNTSSNNTPKSNNTQSPRSNNNQSPRSNNNQSPRNNSLNRSSNRNSISNSNNRNSISSNSNNRSSNAKQANNKKNSNNNAIDELLAELNKKPEENNITKNNNTAKNNTSNNAGNNNVNNVGNAISNALNNATEEPSTLWTIIYIILIGLLFIVIINVVKYFYTTYENYKTNSPWLLEGNKNAKHALIISQNPENKKTPKIHRSEGQNGIEFTYSLWMLIDDFNYKQSDWKHVFHKGNESAYPAIAPGVWIHPNKNMLRVYMNTHKKIHEYVDIADIPLRKWIHLGIVIREQSMEIYINGYLKVKQKLSSLPRQNNEDLWLNLNGGFEGFVSRMRYYTYAITPAELADIIRDGPANSACIDTAEIPPYLDDNWWF